MESEGSGEEAIRKARESLEPHLIYISLNVRRMSTVKLLKTYSFLVMFLLYFPIITSSSNLQTMYEQLMFIPVIEKKGRSLCSFCHLMRWTETLVCPWEFIPDKCLRSSQGKQGRLEGKDMKPLQDISDSAAPLFPSLHPTASLLPLACILNQHIPHSKQQPQLLLLSSSQAPSLPEPLKLELTYLEGCQGSTQLVDLVW